MKINEKRFKKLLKSFAAGYRVQVAWYLLSDLHLAPGNILNNFNLNY
jgi:hypothetical protein